MNVPTVPSSAANAIERRLLREKKDRKEIAESLKPYNDGMRKCRQDIADIQEMFPGARARAEEIIAEEHERRDGIREAKARREAK